MTESKRYLIVTYRRSVSSDYFRPRLESDSDFEQIHCSSHKDAINRLTALLSMTAQEKLDRCGNRETDVYINGFGPNGRYCEDWVDVAEAENVSCEEVEALHDIAVIWIAATELAEHQIQARAEQLTIAKAAREKAQAEQARLSAEREIERLRKLHGLT